MYKTFVVLLHERALREGTTCTYVVLPRPVTHPSETRVVYTNPADGSAVWNMEALLHVRNITCFHGSQELVTRFAMFEEGELGRAGDAHQVDQMYGRSHRRWHHASRRSATSICMRY